MDAADPATWAALTFVHFVTHNNDMFGPGGGLFYGDDPADPFIARQRSDVFPRFAHFAVCLDCFAHIGGECMYRTACE